MTTSQWDFIGNWLLHSGYYVSPPSSISIVPTNSYSTLKGFVKTTVVPNDNVKQGRFITWFRVCEGTLYMSWLKFYFRYQDVNNYYMIEIHRISGTNSIKVWRRKLGVDTQLGECQDPDFPTWHCWAVGGWDAVRITWLVDMNGQLVIRVDKWTGAWTHLMFAGSYDVVDPNNYWASGGRVGFCIDSYLFGATWLDDTEIWGLA